VFVYGRPSLAAVGARPCDTPGTGIFIAKVKRDGYMVPHGSSTEMKK